MVFAVAVGLGSGAGRSNAVIFQECPQAAAVAVGNFHPGTKLAVQGSGAAGPDPSKLIKPKTVINSKPNLMAPMSESRRTRLCFMAI